MIPLAKLCRRKLSWVKPKTLGILLIPPLCFYLWCFSVTRQSSSLSVEPPHILVRLNHIRESLNNKPDLLTPIGVPTIQRKKSETHIGHGSYDTYSIPRRMTCQSEPSQHSIHYRMPANNHMTISKCIKFCSKQSTTYAALSEGTHCYCTHSHGTNFLEPSTECNMSCSGEESASCGGKDRWMFYKVGDADGNRGWSVWTAYGDKPEMKTSLRTRYRGCTGDKFEKRSCLVTHQSILKDNSSVELQMVQKYYIGCFTNQTWSRPRLSFIVSNVLKEQTRSALDCLGHCQRKSFYAIFLESGCVCSNSLGWSRPVDTCINNYGAIVLSTSAIQNSRLTLKFEARLTRRNVALVSHYRAGSTFSSLMFSEHPDSLYIFEPASVYHLVWNGVNNSLAHESARTKDFLEHVYPLWFECEASDLPGVWLRRYPFWGEHNAGMNEYKSCRYAAKHRVAWAICSGFIEEKCLMSVIVAAKTTRVIHADNLRSFIKLSPNIDFVHALRDPRGTLSSRRQLTAYYRSNYEMHLETSCWELNRLADIFNSGDYRELSNLHTLHYEDLANATVKTAMQLYQELDMKLPEEVVHSLNMATGNDNSTNMARRNAYDVKQSKPSSRINRWIKSLPAAAVHTADQSIECRRFFSTFSSHYKPLAEMRNDSS
ncbi:uncharacterized protein [Watersipora subatra]|uniref:uncharacterized protein n=1 Tax=Watersipora subatra TaxID=2589382 RepID=UPI00355C2022